MLMEFSKKPTVRKTWVYGSSIIIFKLNSDSSTNSWFMRFLPRVHLVFNTHSEPGSSYDISDLLIIWVLTALSINKIC